MIRQGCHLLLIVESSPVRSHRSKTQLLPGPMIGVLSREAAERKSPFPFTNSLTHALEAGVQDCCRRINLPTRKATKVQGASMHVPDEPAHPYPVRSHEEKTSVAASKPFLACVLILLILCLDQSPLSCERRHTCSDLHVRRFSGAAALHRSTGLVVAETVVRLRSAAELE